MKLEATGAAYRGSVDGHVTLKPIETKSKQNLGASRGFPWILFCALPKAFPHNTPKQLLSLILTPLAFKALSFHPNEVTILHEPLLACHVLLLIAPTHMSNRLQLCR